MKKNLLMLLLLVPIWFGGWYGLAFSGLLAIVLYFYFNSEMKEVTAPMRASQCVLKFQGFPVAGPVDIFKEKLLKEGWRYGKKSDNEFAVCMKGKFLDEQDATINIFFTRKTRYVRSVVVSLGPYNKETLNERYDTICNLIGKEHAGGKPTNQYISTTLNYIVQVESKEQNKLEVSYINIHNEAVDQMEAKQS